MLTYLFDPLCGWCYAASPALAQTLDAGIEIEMLPTGLFTGAGSRIMDTAFAAHAWSNDQRIEGLTGQRFTEIYKKNLLSAGAQFDSGPATLALTAVKLTAPERLFEALKAIQYARYVEGKDTSAVPTLHKILTDNGLIEAANRLAAPDKALRTANAEWVAAGQRLMRELGARGVPTIVNRRTPQAQLIHSSVLYHDPGQLAANLTASSNLPESVVARP